MREQCAQTWDLLRITPLPIWTVIWGKIRAGWDRTAPLYIRLIGLKLLVLIWQLAEIYTKAHATLRRYPDSSAFEDGDFMVLSAAALLFLIVYLLLDMVFAPVLGTGIALVTPVCWRRLGLGLGLVARWCLPMLTLFCMVVWQAQGTDPLPTQWNTHLSLAARYTEQYGFGGVGYSGAVEDVFPSLTIIVPDGPLLVFMHTTATYDVTNNDYFMILLCSVLGYLGLVLGVLALERISARLRYG
jgi:hypothetical protein